TASKWAQERVSTKRAFSWRLFSISRACSGRPLLGLCWWRGSFSLITRQVSFFRGQKEGHQLPDECWRGLDLQRDFRGTDGCEVETELFHRRPLLGSVIKFFSRDSRSLPRAALQGMLWAALALYA